MNNRLDITTTALIDCDACRREVEAIHADCDACFNEFPDKSPLERCEHFTCRRCGAEI